MDLFLRFFLGFFALLLSAIILGVIALGRESIWKFTVEVWSWIGRVAVNVWDFVVAVWKWIGGWFPAFGQKVWELVSGLNLLFFAIVIGLGVLVVPYWNVCTWRELATPMLGALACLGAGGVVGFLFGVPRTTPNMTPNTLPSQTPTPTPTPSANPSPTPAANPTAGAGALPASAQPAPRVPPAPTPNASVASQAALQRRSGHDVNANLEQISDWLTKIVVGIGLVEMKNIPGHLESMAERFVEDLGWPANRSFAVALIVYFAAMGFLYGYLLTRLRLSGAIRRADEDLWGQGELDKVMDNLDLVRKLGELNTAIAISHQMLSLKTDVYIDRAIRDLTKARADFLDDRRAAIVLGRLYVREARFDDAIRVLEETLAEMEKRGTKTTKDEADLRYNIACYLCLRSALPTTGAIAKASDLVKMYAELSRSILLLPENAEEAAADRDFMSVRHTDEFVRLVYSDAIRSLDNKLHVLERANDAEKNKQKIAEVRYQLAQYYALRSALVKKLEGNALVDRTEAEKKDDRDKMADFLKKSREFGGRLENALWRESVLKDDCFRAFHDNADFKANLLAIAPDPCPANPVPTPSTDAPVTNPAG